jgi:hypothetical protein
MVLLKDMRHRAGTDILGLTTILGTAQLPRLSLAEMLFETRSMWQ